MARPKNPEERIEVKIRLLAPTLAKLDLISLDPLTQRLAYGQRNIIIEQALEEYFATYFPTHQASK